MQRMDIQADISWRRTVKRIRVAEDGPEIAYARRNYKCVIRHKCKDRYKQHRRDNENQKF
ncbi:hypothetical protein ASF90_04965 [Xanthomonas sp. Leaf148]|nr:hypothetical protein ASF90_04965 [Xanthomonas sp. Leaf148]